MNFFEVDQKKETEQNKNLPTENKIHKVSMHKIVPSIQALNSKKWVLVLHKGWISQNNVSMDLSCRHLFMWIQREPGYVGLPDAQHEQHPGQVPSDQFSEQIIDQ